MLDQYIENYRLSIMYFCTIRLHSSIAFRKTIKGSSKDISYRLTSLKLSPSFSKK